MQWRQTDNVPPSSLRINSPYDTEARYAHKRSTTWVGYKVRLTETCDEETPNIITNVHTNEAVVNDNDALPEIHQQLSRSEMLPDKHLADAGYVEAKRLVESQREYGVELIGPVQGHGRWQHVQGNGFTEASQSAGPGTCWDHQRLEEWRIRSRIVAIPVLISFSRRLRSYHRPRLCPPPSLRPFAASVR